MKDFAFALLIGVASGAYSSIFIASPVLTHWKEREPQYRARRARIEEEFGEVPAYAASGSDVEPVRKKLTRPGRLTTPEPDTVSASEFEQMKRDLDVQQGLPLRHTSTLSKRLAHSEGPDAAAEPARGAKRTPRPDGDGAAYVPAPDVPENEGVAPTPKPKRPAKSRSRNRRHGRRR